MDKDLVSILENLPGGISDNKTFITYQKDIIYNNIDNYDITMSQSYFKKISALFPKWNKKIKFTDDYDNDFIQLKIKKNNDNNLFLSKLIIYSCYYKNGDLFSSLTLTNINNNLEQVIDIVKSNENTKMTYRTINKNLKTSNNIDTVDLVFDREGNIILLEDDIHVFNQVLFKNLFSEQANSIYYLMNNSDMNNSHILDQLCGNIFKNDLSNRISVNLPEYLYKNRFKLLDLMEIGSINSELEIYFRRYNTSYNSDIVNNIMNRLLIDFEIDDKIVFQKIFIDSGLTYNDNYFNNLSYFCFIMHEEKIYYLDIIIKDDVIYSMTEVPFALIKCFYLADEYNKICEQLKTLMVNK